MSASSKYWLFLPVDIDKALFMNNRSDNLAVAFFNARISLGGGQDQ
jgi:hypothetical protein